MSQSHIQNKLLLKLTRSDRDYVMASMTRVELRLKQELMTCGDVISYVYFPESGVVSLLAKTPNERAVEVGMFGFEGMSNMVLRLGDKTALTALVQVAGTAWRIKNVTPPNGSSARSEILAQYLSRKPPMAHPPPRPPPTIFDLKQMNLTGVVVSCTGCGRMSIVDWDALKLDDTTPFPDIARLKRFACAGCRSKSVNVRPDWRGYKPQGGRS